MQYFVTGATGFIGKRLVKALLARKGAVVHFLLREESQGKVAELLRGEVAEDRHRARLVDAPVLEQLGHLALAFLAQ